MSESANWSDEVTRLVSEARKEEQRYNTAEAIGLYQKAVSLIPEPVEDNPDTSLIYATIGELYFLDNHWEEAFEYYSRAVRSKGGLGRPEVHLRLGQLRYERGELDRARDELMRAYMGMPRIFELEDSKYFELIKDVI
jgi:tetratricopeptide (TPR) repeat protein